MDRIDKLLIALKPFPETNDKPEGRVMLILRWFKQEIEAVGYRFRQIQSIWGTLKYIVADGTPNYIPGVEQPLAELTSILEGHGLIKPRHYPAMISQIDDMLALVPKDL
jgi:hypothetical protein